MLGSYIALGQGRRGDCLPIAGHPQGVPLRPNKKGGARRPSLETYCQTASENELQSHLDLTRYIDLALDIPETTLIESGRDVAELRMVEGIEGFRPELQLHPLGRVELAEQPEIHRNVGPRFIDWPKGLC